MPRQRIHEKQIYPAHILHLSFKVTCDICEKRTRDVWKKYKKNVCWECGTEIAAKTTNRPFATLVAGCLLLLAGCQAPRMMNAEIQVAGQQVKVSVMR